MALLNVIVRGAQLLGYKEALKRGLTVKPIVVVVFTTGPKKYAYHNPGLEIEKGDTIMVPTASGVDLEATVVLMTGADRWGSMATKEVIG